MLGDDTVIELLFLSFFSKSWLTVGIFKNFLWTACRTIVKPFFVVISSIWSALWNWVRGILWQFNTFAYHMEFSLRIPPKGCYHQQSCHINLVKYNSNEIVFLITLLWNQFPVDRLVCLLAVPLVRNRICDAVWTGKVASFNILQEAKIIRFNVSQESIWKAAKIVKGCSNCGEIKMEKKWIRKNKNSGF